MQILGVNDGVLMQVHPRIIKLGVAVVGSYRSDISIS
jgi:hypothetical protein